MRPVYHVRTPLWPPPPSLFCALFPYVRMLYEYLRTRVTRALVHGQVPARRQPVQVARQRRQQQQQHQQRRQVARQELPRWREHQEQSQRLRRPQEQRDQQQQQERLQRLQQQEQPNHNGFGAAAAGLAIRRVTDSSIGRLICGALVIPTIARTMGAILLHLSHLSPFVRIVIASRPPSPHPPPPPSHDAAIGVLGGLLGLWDCTRDCARTAFGLRVSDGDNARTADIRAATGGDDDGLGGSGNTILGGLLATSEEWATSDPVWYDVFLCLICH